MKLSEQQKKAVDHFNGPALVLSVPGSGKTTVLLKRINALKEKGINSNKIMTLTFGKVQADDMVKRYASNDGHFYTIHSFCYQLVQGYLKKENRNKTLIEGIGKKNKYHIVSSLYRELFDKYVDDTELDEFFRIYGYIVNTMKKDISIYDEKYQDLIKSYNDIKIEKHWMDFDDLLSLALDILEKEKDWTKRLQRRFPYVQIDEAQDTSKIQMKIIKKITEPNNNLFILADDDQSIYGFRGSDPKPLLEFNKEYPEGSFYYLENNYRSSPSIIKAASHLIKKNEFRHNKEMNPINQDNSPVLHKIIRNTARQSEIVIDEIKKLDKDKNIAILYRNQISGLPIAAYLKTENIPFNNRRNWNEYSNHIIIRDLINFIELADRPWDHDLFMNIYYKMNSYISKEMALKAIPQEGSTVFDALLEDKYLPDWRRDQLKGLKRHFNRLKKLKFNKKFKYIMDEINYQEYIMEWKRHTQGKDQIELFLDIFHSLSQKSENIEELLDLMNPKSVKDSNIHLSTIHGAKGLEYDHVIMIDCNQYEFPGNFREEGDISEDEYIEEERRLFYVGMTRAKEKLQIFSLRYRNGRYLEPSRFIKEIKS